MSAVGLSQGALSEKGRLSLVKIHGSVNWFKDEHTIKAIQPKFTRNGQLSVSGADPDLIYPASDKLYQTYSAPYSELMRHMLDEMETGSNVIMVLGYKYGDDHVNEILYKALGNQDNTFYFFSYGETEGSEFIQKMIVLEKRRKTINILSGHIFPAFNIFADSILPSAEEIY